MKPFATLGEQLKAVYDLRKGLVADERLEKVNNAAGVTSTNGPDGGFALQEDFAGAILESAVRQSPLLNRLDRYTCSSAANAMRWLHADRRISPPACSAAFRCSGRRRVPRWRPASPSSGR